MRPLCHVLILWAAHALSATIVWAQAPVYELPPGGIPTERLAPGAHTPYDDHNGGGAIGGRPGSLRPRVPINQRHRGPSQVAPLPPLPQPGETTSRPMLVPNAWTLLFEIENEGPPYGLTLDAAIDRLVNASIILRAKALDIPQAQADVLTAGMHANPVVYFDGQMIPYRPYNPATNPGGQTQYDVNMAYPVDLSGKRQSRVDVACAAQRVVEALYQDAVRMEIDRLTTAYVDALAARLAVRTTKGGLTRIDDLRKRADGEAKNQPGNEAVVRQLQLQRQMLVLALIDAEAAWRNNQRALSTMLDLPREQIAMLELRGSLEDNAPPPPALDTLISSALANRPDLAAYRLGYRRAEADVQLSKANRLPDVYLLYQPYTLQNNAPYNAPNSTSWAVGATVTVPLFDRNQGNIRRATVNVTQSQLEWRAIEQRVTNEVETAYEEYVTTQKAIDEIEKELFPEDGRKRTEMLERHHESAAGYLKAQRDLDDLGQQYRDWLLRHRRSMLGVNTAVGVRVFP